MMPSEMGVQLRWEPMRMPVESVGGGEKVDEGEVAAFG